MIVGSHGFSVADFFDYAEEGLGISDEDQPEQWEVEFYEQLARRFMHDKQVQDYIKVQINSLLIYYSLSDDELDDFFEIEEGALWKETKDLAEVFQDFNYTSAINFSMALMDYIDNELNIDEIMRYEIVDINFTFNRLVIEFDQGSVHG